MPKMRWLRFVGVGSEFVVFKEEKMSSEQFGNWLRQDMKIVYVTRPRISRSCNVLPDVRIGNE